MYMAQQGKSLKLKKRKRMCSGAKVGKADACGFGGHTSQCSGVPTAVNTEASFLLQLISCPITKVSLHFMHVCRIDCLCGRVLGPAEPAAVNCVLSGIQQLVRVVEGVGRGAWIGGPGAVTDRIGWLAVILHLQQSLRGHCADATVVRSVEL